MEWLRNASKRRPDHCESAILRQIRYGRPCLHQADALVSSFHNKLWHTLPEIQALNVASGVEGLAAMAIAQHMHAALT